jgi:hypothetical protein
VHECVILRDLHALGLLEFLVDSAQLSSEVRLLRRTSPAVLGGFRQLRSAPIALRLPRLRIQQHAHLQRGESVIVW